MYADVRVLLVRRLHMHIRCDSRALFKCIKVERDLFGEESLQLPVGGEHSAVGRRARAAAAAAPGGQRGERVGVERGLVERQARVDVRRALRVVVHEEHHRRPVEARVPAGRQRARALREPA